MFKGLQKFKYGLLGRARFKNLTLLRTNVFAVPLLSSVSTSTDLSVDLPIFGLFYRINFKPTEIPIFYRFFAIFFFLIGHNGCDCEQHHSAKSWSHNLDLVPSFHYVAFALQIKHHEWETEEPTLSFLRMVGFIEFFFSFSTISN